MKAVAGTMRSDLAQFRDLEELRHVRQRADKTSQAQLDRGYRLTELLKQPLNSPVPVEEQVIVIYAGTRGWVDTVPVSEVRRFESELLAFMRSSHADLLSHIKETGTLPDTSAIDAALQTFLGGFDTRA